MRRDTIQHGDLFFDVKNFADGYLALLAAPHRVDLDELAGIAEGKRTNQKSVDEAEDRRIGADRQAEREHDGRREGRLAADLAKAEAKIAPQRFHRTDSLSCQFDRSKLNEMDGQSTPTGGQSLRVSGARSTGS